MVNVVTVISCIVHNMISYLYSHTIIDRTCITEYRVLVVAGCSMKWCNGTLEWTTGMTQVI